MKSPMFKYAQVLAGLVTVVSMFWLYFDKSLEPLVVSLASLGALVTVLIKDKPEPETEAHSIDSKEEQRREHDLKIIGQIFTTLPYRQVIEETQEADHAGISESLWSALNEIPNFKKTPFQLYNEEVEELKREFIETATEYYNEIAAFLTYDERYKRPMPPYELKGTEREPIYRDGQRRVRNSGGHIRAMYDAFIAECKGNDLYVA